MANAVKRVQVIRATKGQNDYGKIRMAAYCRVSTDSSDQANSFMAQMQYYNDYIRQNPNMVLVDIYADEGITGTSIEKRSEFKRLLRDCENHKIDRVIVKSVTRFARNSLECLETIRTMQSCGVSVYFETDNIDTANMNSELLLYIKSAFAQGEALAASARMQTSIRMKMENGTYVVSSAPFGYRYELGKLIVVPEEASIVREIYDWYLSGKGFDAIAATLNRRYGGGWHPNRVRYILTNEKYIGDTMWQKTYTPQMLPLRNVINNGVKPKYYVEGTHEAIISVDDFKMVQQIISQHAKNEKLQKKTHFFPVGVVCRHCGWSFSRKSSSPHLIACSKKGLSGTECPSRSYSREELSDAFIRMYNTLRQNEHRILDETLSRLHDFKTKLTGQDEQIAAIDSDIALLCEQFYEYVFDVSDDKANKFNTFVCYSFKNIRFDYDLKLLLAKKEITYLNTKIFINVIYDYEYSIRPRAFQNLLYLINYDDAKCKRDKEYSALMKTIKDKRKSLVDLIDSEKEICLAPDGYYTEFISKVKEFLRSGKLGGNLIRFLLSDMRNRTIRAQAYKQYGSMPTYNDKFDGLRIRLVSKSFELMPFAFSPKEARPSLYTLFELYDASDSADEILYNYLVNYINQNNTLFVKPSDIGYSVQKFIELKNRFNEKLLRINSYYSDHRIIESNGYYTVESYYNSTKNVILKAAKLCKTKNIQVDDDYSENTILSAEQKNILSKSLKNSSVALITGSAGTGKTTIIKEFIKNNPDKRILCLTTTNTANNNLKIKDFAGNITYKNIARFEKERAHEDYDIIIVDEASFVSTDSIEKIIGVYESSAFMFVGDPGQIESIEFGNWFNLLLNLLKVKDVVFTLDVEYRTNVAELSKVWDEVRHGKKKNIIELLAAYEMTEEISDDIFKIQDNEVVLCLNYDGLYGINNINRYLQASNPNDSFEYQQNLYKVGDPVVFITNDYSECGIYNNLNGKIVEIKDEDENITFKVKLSDSVNFVGKLSSEIEVTEEGSEFYVVVTKMKYYNDKYDTDMDIRTKLPFQVSYAMSIHKAQGLEFDSVKIVITKESDEQVTKNIFYTAVTRVTKGLKVYWQPEVADFVLGNIENGEKSKTADLSVLSEQLKEYL